MTAGKYVVKKPASLPLTVPFAIRPNSIYGVHVKYWLLVELIFVGAIIYVSSIVGIYSLFLLAPLLGVLGLIGLVGWMNRKNSLTVTTDSITYVKNGVTQVIPMTDLASVEWGLMYAGTRLYYVLHVKNKAGDIHWKFTVLYFWNSRELRTVYTSVPAQYQGAQDVQPF